MTQEITVINSGNAEGGPNNRPEPYNVLFADTFNYRHTQFRVRPGSTKCWIHQRHAHNTGEFLLALKERAWDAVFVPGYFDKGDDFKEIIREIAKIVGNKPPRLIIFHGGVDTNHFVEQISSLGVPVAHVPWNHTTPSLHERKPVDKKED